VGGNGFWLIDHGDPIRTANAYAFVQWMVEPGRLADYIVRTGYIPPSVDVAFEPSVLARWDEYPQLRVGFDQLAAQSGSDADAGAVFGPSVEIDYVFYRLTNRVLTDGMPIDEALDELTTDVQAELDRYEAVVGT
jgi:ABC-type glycerol-3-phosphate transport system substrate-binding protein